MGAPAYPAVMTPDTEQRIVAGDYVRLEPTRDVWKVLRIKDDGTAVLSPSSITLAGRPRRVAEVARLQLVRPSPLHPVDIDEAF